MIKDHFKLAVNNLRQRGIRSWLTMIGIFIGITAVIALIGLGEGLRIAISSQFGFLGTDVLSIQASGIDFAGPPGFGAAKPLSNDLLDEIERINGVEAAYNRYIESTTMEFNDQQEIAFATSVPLGEDRKIFERIANFDIADGRMLREGDTRKLLLGNQFSDDTIFGEEITAGEDVVLNGKTFQVVGILEKKGNFIIDGAVFLNEDDLLDVFGDDGTADLIAVKVRDENEIDRIQESIERYMRKERDVKEGEEDFTVETPQKTLESLNSTLFAVQLFVYIIAGISIVVGGIGIMNTMYTAVLERTKEIGIMKAIGARNSTIFTLFFIESGFLGLVGGLIGVICGFLLASGLATVGRAFLGSDLITASVPIYLIIGALTGSFLLGTLFGVLPAIQASKLQPVEALRKE